ncbi:MAG: DUF4258 domain-containing protein [Paracoccaceae bacterium]
MKNVVQFKKPMRADEFENTVKERSKFSHMVFMTDHIKAQMAKRRISQRQIINVLRKGKMANDPQENQAHASIEGKMKYHGTGREITVVCGIQQSNLLVFAITVY